MKIAIDCRFAAVQYGLGRYTRGVVAALLKQNLSCSWVLLVHMDDPLDWLPTTESVTLVPMKSAYYSLAEQFELRSVLQTHKPQKLFVPHFNIPILTSVPVVCTIHDLILHAYPNTSNIVKKIAYRFLMRVALMKCVSIVAVSTFTKQQLIDVYGSKYSVKIVHCTEGIEPIFTRTSEKNIQACLVKYAISLPYFLYVGSSKPHKQVPELIESFLAAKRPNTMLILACDNPTLQQTYECDIVEFIPTTTDAELLALYSGALCFITASIYEGFCLPIIEARACSCPIIAYCVTAIQELQGKDMQLVQPHRSNLISAISEFDSTNFTPPSARPASWNEAIANLIPLLLS